MILEQLISATFETRTSEHEPQAKGIHTTKVNAIVSELIIAGVDFKVMQMNVADTFITRVLVCMTLRTINNLRVLCHYLSGDTTSCVLTSNRKGV